MARKGSASYSPFEKHFSGSIECPVGPDGLRNDGRRSEEMRLAFLKTGMVTRAAGSAYIEFGNTKVLVAVYGPRESKRAQTFSDLGRLTCDVKIAPFAALTRSKSLQVQTGEEREYSGMLQKALEGGILRETFPKATVDVYALILQLGGSDLAAVITASSMALADAGIAMLDLVVATSASLWKGQMLLDPSTDESRAEDANVMVAYMPSRKEITQISLSGEWSDAQTTEAIELSVDGCSKLDELMRTCLKEQAATGD